MTINRELWLKESFTAKSKTPNWPCPICHNGIIQKDGESTKQLYSKETEKGDRNLMYSSDAIAEFRFHGYLKCSNCLERVVIAGKGNVQDSQGNVTRAGFKGDRYSVFYPKYFEPHLSIFTITENIPLSVASELNAAFSTFWIDNGACGNKIRTAIEELLTDQKVKRTYLNKKKKRRSSYSLHERIEKFGATHPDTANHLLAIKWIGNSGT
ncbi:MAG TPA: DUF4145 domain-containing protein, partial [Ohtaekwangia sp.]|nr:DUF4145 domain-containing protein [Ohtaekwangia sp.]